MSRADAAVQRLEELKERFEQRLTGILKHTSLAAAPDRLKESVYYSLRAGGKRIRPVMLLEAAEQVSLEPAKALQLATAVELLHTYSLVHDDLPAMDDDDMRRGRPACHIEFNEATAILAGDGMQSLSFELLAAAGSGAEVFREFAAAVGVAGMVGGQFLDMQAQAPSEKAEKDTELQKLQHMKTGRLIEMSIMLPYLHSGKQIENHHEIRTWASLLGELFQIADDILDETASSDVLGKTAGKDREQNKLTRVSSIGLERARNLASEISADLNARAGRLFNGSVLFSHLPEYITTRGR